MQAGFKGCLVRAGASFAIGPLAARPGSAAPVRCGQPVKDRLVQGTNELHASDRPVQPANRSLDRLEAVELDPDALANDRSFDEFDLAAHGRTIKNAHSKSLQASAPNANFGLKGQSGGAARPRRTAIIGNHGRVLTKIAFGFTSRIGSVPPPDGKRASSSWEQREPSGTRRGLGYPVELYETRQLSKFLRVRRNKIDAGDAKGNCRSRPNKCLARIQGLPKISGKPVAKPGLPNFRT